ncbi:UDP-N-acetylmuramate dehydrogenase [bacterium]|nr:UDP-N-acetylmuramate dehydrogenase [bacterium]
MNRAMTDYNMNIQKNYSLKNLSYVKLGGRAKYLALPSCLKEFKALMSDLREKEILFCMVGNGSNILFSDKGYDGYIISFRDMKSEIEIKENFAKVFGHVTVANFVDKLYNKSLSGAEFLEGIPGCVLPSLFVNASAKGGSFSDIVSYVKAFDKQGQDKVFDKNSIKFSYRKNNSLDEHILYEAGFCLIQKSKQEIKDIIEKNRLDRKQSQPGGCLSLGCVFKNPQGESAGRLIDMAGLKGKSFGDIFVSEVHANFFVNRGNGTASDYYKLIRFVQEEVFKKFGVSLELEIKLVGEF